MQYLLVSTQFSKQNLFCTYQSRDMSPQYIFLSCKSESPPNLSVQTKIGTIYGNTKPHTWTLTNQSPTSFRANFWLFVTPIIWGTGLILEATVGITSLSVFLELYPENHRHFNHQSFSPRVLDSISTKTHHYLYNFTVNIFALRRDGGDIWLLSSQIFLNKCFFRTDNK